MKTRHPTGEPDKHTPGPWTTEAGVNRAWIASVGNNPDDPQIWREYVAKPGENYVWGTKEADARLMAAAPELLDALKKMIAWWEEDGGSMDALIYEAREAIAKATEPQP